MMAHPYPESEHVDDIIDYISTNSAELLMRQRETLLSLMDREEGSRRRDERRDEGVCLLEWMLARRPAQHSATITPAEALRWLADITSYGSRGVEAPWIAETRQETRS